MKIFNTTFKSINEKELVYKYIDSKIDCKANGIEYVYKSLENSTNEIDRFLYTFFKYHDQQAYKNSDEYNEEQANRLTKEHIDTALSDRRLKDLLFEMTEYLDESIYRVQERLPAYFIGEDYDNSYLAFKDEEYVYKDDPITWFGDIKALKKEILFLMEKFFEKDEHILGVEQYAYKCQYKILKRYITLIADGWARSFIEEEMEIVQKYAIKYIWLKHSKKEDVASLAVEFEYAFSMVLDFINFIYQRAFGRQELRLYYENKEQLNDRIEEEIEEVEKKEPVRALSAEEIETLLNGKD